MTGNPDGLRLLAPIDQAPTGVWCFEIEMAAPVGISSVAPMAPVHAVGRGLVRLHGEPLGYITVDLAPGGIDRELCLSVAWLEFGDRINAHLRREQVVVADLCAGDTIPDARPTCPNAVVSKDLVSIVVCTRNRSEILAGCLQRLGALTYPNLEILVVDNAPSSSDTRRLVEEWTRSDSRFRYVLEPRPGLSCARNRGLAEATGALVAFTDDDVSVDARWVQGIVRGFQSAPAVGCVTGLVCTASIDSAAEAFFDARSPSWSARCDEEIFDLADHQGDSALYPFSPGIFGTGANFAFDRESLSRVGQFDEALGAGTATRGGEDLDMFVRVILSGHAIVYQPAAIVWHHHRADEAALVKQMFGYGTGMSAFLTKCLINRSTRMSVLRRIPPGVRGMLAIRSNTEGRLVSNDDVPKGAWTREMVGYLCGPWLYLTARHRTRSATRAPSAVVAAGHP